MTCIRNRHRRRGFTITELAVVTSMTAVAVAVALPTVQVTRQQGKTVVGLANLQHIGQTAYVFTIDNDNSLPYGYFRDALPSQEPGRNETDWTILLNDFLTGHGATYDDLASNKHTNELLPIFRDPNATYPDQGLYHYASHPVLMPDKNEWKQPYSIHRLRRPHEVFLVADAIQRPTGHIPRTSFATLFAVDDYSLVPAAQPFYRGSDTDNDQPIDPGINEDPITQGHKSLANIRWRQKGETAANFVFADGHCETRRMSEITKRNIRVDP